MSSSRFLLEMPISRRALALIIVFTTITSLAVWYRDPIGRLDLLAYISAFQLFVNGGDPYSSSQLYAKQQELGVARSFAVSMWNPPLFFSLFSPLLSLPVEIAPCAARALSFACALMLAYAGYRLSSPTGRPHVTLLAYLVPAVGLLPFWEEVRLAQNTSWVALAVAGGCYLFIRRERSYIAGMLLAFSACKPHNFFIPLLLISAGILRTRNYRVVCGSLALLLVAGGLPEFIHPGIWSEWLFRKEWPTHAYCANLSTVLMLILRGGAHDKPWMIPLLSVVLGFLAWGYGVRRYRLADVQSRLMWGWLVTPFFAPYGYLSDHVTLIFPLAYFSGHLGCRKGVEAQSPLLLILLLLSIGGLLLPANPFSGESLSWFLFAPGALITVAATLSDAPIQDGDEPAASR